MDKHDATETAYHNGYADGFAAAKKSLLPCKIGDKVFGLRRYGDQRLLKYGKVKGISYNEKMELEIHVHQIGKGIWGRDIFGTEADALAALHGFERRM